MILRSGGGRRRTSVGMARMSSPPASDGFSTRSMISISYWPARCSSHRSFRLAKARSDLGDWPATYRRRYQHTSVAAGLPAVVVRRVPSPLPVIELPVVLTTSRRGCQCVGDVDELVGVGAAEPALLGTLAGSILDTGRAVAQQASHDVGFVLELAPQRRRLCLDRLASPLEVGPALLEVLLACRPVGALLGLLGLAGGAGEHALRPDVDVGQLDALVGEEELADLVGVRHPPGLEHVQHAVVLAVALHAS